jgi:hypothetical protein
MENRKWDKKGKKKVGGCPLPPAAKKAIDKAKPIMNSGGTHNHELQQNWTFTQNKVH